MSRHGTRGAVAAVALLGAVFLPAWGAAPDPPACSGWKAAYSLERKERPRRRAERRALEAGARREAFAELARMAWSAAEGERFLEKRETVADDRSARVSTRLETRYREYYAVDENLRGGWYEVREEGTWQVRYCVRGDRFDRAREELRRRRREEVDAFLARMERLERGIGEWPLARLRASVIEMSADAQRRLLGAAFYRSVVTGESRPVDDWLRAWRERFRGDEAYARALLGQARTQVREGHLGEATESLRELEQISPREPELVALRGEIRDLRRDRETTLARAVSRAEEGRFRSARAALERGRRIDLDDPGPWEEASHRVAYLEEVYRRDNPRIYAGVRLGSRPLGFDAGQAGQALGLGRDALDPVHPLGLFVEGRVSRNVVLFGEAARSSTTAGAGPAGLDVDWNQQLLGIAWRQPRTHGRVLVAEFGGGIVREDVSVSPSRGPGVEGDVTGWFVQAAIEGTNGLLYLRRGFGMEEDAVPGGKRWWQDSTEVGLVLFLAW